VAQGAINDDMKLFLSVTAYLGAVTGTPTFQLQTQAEYRIWRTIKSSPAAVVSTDTTVTVTLPSTLTAASHGYTAGQMVTINSSGTVPGGLLPGSRYFVAAPTTNTFMLSLMPSTTPAPVQFSDAGSGTITVTAAQAVVLLVNNATADSSVLPMDPRFRINGVCTGGQSMQFIGLSVGHQY
jgi:hypothetical protein